jgi:SMEK domain-containing protein
MITRGKQIEEIIEKIAILKHEIALVGISGLVNLNKHCENFALKLLNLIYDCNFQNLNETTSNFPGLDIGDKSAHVATAYQITAIKRSDKIEEVLEKCLEYEHYKTFRIINVLILTDKQDSYNIKTVTEPFFSFNPKTNIIDFNDLIKVIGHLEDNRVTKIHNFISEQLPFMNRDSKMQDSIPILDKVIDAMRTVEDIHLPYFSYSSWRIKMNASSFSAPMLYRKINEFYDDAWKKNFLSIINPLFKKIATPTEIVFKIGPATYGASNHFYETSFKIARNELLFENAQYTNSAPLLTNLTSEIGSLISVLLFCKKLISAQALNVDLILSLESNGELVLSQQNSILKLDAGFNKYSLHENKFELKTIVSNTSNEALFSIAQELLNSFVSQASFLSDEPFINIREENFRALINVLRENFEVPS